MGCFVQLRRDCARFGEVGNTFFAKFFLLLYSVGNKGFRFEGVLNLFGVRLSPDTVQNCVHSLFSLLFKHFQKTRFRT